MRAWAGLSRHWQAAASPKRPTLTQSQSQSQSQLHRQQEQQEQQ